MSRQGAFGTPPLRRGDAPATRRTVVLFLVLLLALSAGAAALWPAAAQTSYTFTLTASPTSLQPGSQVSFSGTVCPSPNAPVGLGANITYTAPNGTRFVRSGTLGYGGGWCSSPFGIDTLIPDAAGTWTAVSWVFWAEGGTGPYDQVMSNSVTVQVSSSTTTTTSTTTTGTTSTPPTSQCNGASPGNSSSVSLGPHCYNYETLAISSSSLAVYYSESTSIIDTGLMSQSQLSQFQATGDFPGAMGQYGSYQSGTKNLNALLLVPGTYYLVVGTGSAPAQVNYTYFLDTSLAVENDTTSVGKFLIVPPLTSYYIPVHDETTGSPSTMDIFGISNATLKYALFDNDTRSYVAPLTPGQSRAVTITNLTETPRGPAFGYNLSLPMAYYILNLTNPNPSPAFAFFSYAINPAYVDPFLFPGLLSTHPVDSMGLASFGVTPQGSGSPRTYFVTSHTVTGFANITSIKATSGCRGLVAAAEDASLQLNSILVVTHANTPPGVYWPQNVPVFNTGCGTWYYQDDNVYNMTGDGAFLTNGTITSADGGWVANACTNCAAPQDYYGIQYPSDWDATHMKPYAFPLAFYVFMNETVVPGQGVVLSEGIRILQNGTMFAHPETIIFDTITIHDPGAQDAFFYVTGVAYTPVAGLMKEHGGFYDTELVFGGGGGGASQNFTSLAATIGLYYRNETTGQGSAFPSYFSFGGDTGESTGNLHVTYLGEGVAVVSVGTPNYEYLTTGSAPPVTTTTASTGASAASGSFPYLYLVVAAVAVVLVVAFVLLKRARGGLPPPPP